MQAANAETVENSDDERHEAPNERIALSAGAAGHSEGTCKPCAWNWKPAGCSKGSECDFCHLCDEGAVRQRRRAKIARLRAEEKAAKRALREKQAESKAETC